FPNTRPRRARANEFSRRMVRETQLSISDLIYPMFVTDGQPIQVESMPGVQRFTLDGLVKEAEQIAKLGIPAIVIFPNINANKKSLTAEEAANPDGLVQQAIRRLKKEIPELGVITDVALDPYTSHGQDGIIDDQGYVLNDRT